MCDSIVYQMAEQRAIGSAIFYQMTKKSKISQTIVLKNIKVYNKYKIKAQWMEKQCFVTQLDH